MIFVLLVAGAYALATLRRYSVAQTATLTTFALFLSSSLTTVSSAPIEHRHHDNMPVDGWASTCYSKAHQHHPIRSHQRLSASRALMLIRRQFNVAQNKINSEDLTVEDIYHNVTEQLKPQLYQPSLPEKQYEWYQREVSSLNMTRKLAVILPKLHDELQKLAIAFYSLRNMPLKKHLNDEIVKRRNNFMDNMAHQVRGLRCEVETRMGEWNMTMPHVYELNDFPRRTEETGFTQMVVLDSGVFRVFKTFVREWKHALRCARNKPKGTCDPAAIGSLKPNVRHRKNNQGNKKHSGKKNVKARKGQGIQISVAGKRAPKAAGRRKAKVIRRKLTGNKQKKTQ